MRRKTSAVGRGGYNHYKDAILNLYKMSDESTRMDMYMTHRDMRERFDKVERSVLDLSLDTDLTHHPGNLC